MSTSRSMFTPLRQALLALVTATAAATAPAAPVLVGTDPAGSNGGFGIGFSFDAGTNLVIAQQFRVGPSAATVGGISVWLNGLGVGSFTLQVMDAIGAGASAANVLLSRTGALPNVTGGHLEVAFGGLALALAGDTDYYLVVSSAAGPDTGWGTTDQLLTGMPGSVGDTYVGFAFGGNVADYTALDIGNPNPLRTQFRIDAAAVPPAGTVAAPATLALAGLALAAMAGLRRAPASR